MLKSLGHTVYFYGGEGSKVECDESIAVVSEQTRKQVYGDYDWKKDFFKHDPKDYVHRSFNSNAIREINKRKQEGDFLLCPMGNYDQPIAEGVKLRFTVESGIGYSGVFAEFRVWESYAWMHHVYGMGGNDQTNGRWYDAVIPNYYNPVEFHMGPPKDYYLYVGRLISRKGLSIAAEVTAKLGAKLIVAGQGDLSKVDSYNLTEAKYGKIEHVGTVDGPQLANLMAGALAVFCPTWYIGPFEGVHIEAAMAGVPTITTDWGVFTETVVQGVTGYRCRTFNDFLHAAREAPKLRGETIRNYAIANFGMSRVASQYQQYFDNLADIRKAGWYEEKPVWNPGWLGRTPPRLAENVCGG
jgi:glycosyltransferase involved in cell wall biosynthesis